MDDAVRQRIRPHSADDRLTFVTPAHLEAKVPVEQPDTEGRTTHHADTHFYAAQANSPKQPQQIGASGTVDLTVFPARRADECQRGRCRDDDDTERHDREEEP